MRDASVFLWSAVIVVAGACADDPADVGGPLDGTWRVARSGAPAPATPADCHALGASAAEIVIDVAGSPQIAAPGSSMPVDSIRLDDTTVTFSMGAVGFVSGEPGWGKVIGHSLTLDADGRLVGTGQVSGCGDDLGCSWTLTVTATRVE